MKSCDTEAIVRSVIDSDAAERLAAYTSMHELIVVAARPPTSGPSVTDWLRERSDRGRARPQQEPYGELAPRPRPRGRSGGRRTHVALQRRRSARPCATPSDRQESALRTPTDRRADSAPGPPGRPPPGRRRFG